jgi:HSP20 family protein
LYDCDHTKRIAFKENIKIMMTFYVSPYRKLARRPHRIERELRAMDQERVLAVDVKSDDEAYTISALVPGIEAEAINVEILNNTVSIHGEFNENAEEGQGNVLVNELPFGRFSRVLRLPTKLDPAKADANLKDGVFTLRVPKAEEDRPKVIKINAN